MIYKLIAVPMLALGTQTTPIPVPPPPPLPTTGTLRCELKSQDGAVVPFTAELTKSEIRKDQKQYPQIKISPENQIFSGVYHAIWTVSGGDFITVSTDGKIIKSLALVMTTWKSGDGAMAGSIKDYRDMRSDPKYYSGFCKSDFPSRFGLLSQ
jgi:hypothetical protein